MMSEWLDFTRKVQEEVYHFFPQFLSVEQKCTYLKDMMFAAFSEIAEIGREFSWKPWAQDEPYVNRQAVIDECVDVLHFIGNALVALNCTDAELEKAYMTKSLINRRRQEEGYLVRDK